MDKDFEKGIERIEEQIRQIESAADPSIRASAVDLVQSLLNLHGAGIERMLEVIAGKEDGQLLIDELGDDELVGSLLILHGLHPFDLSTRVIRALEKVEPYLKSHGGSVELLEITDAGVVRLRLLGSCKSCPSSTVTLKLAIEDAIRQAAPDVTGIEAEGVTPETNPAVIQISRPAGNGTRKESTKTSSWAEVDGLNSLKPSSVRALDISGRSILFCRVGENLYAYGNNCPSCGQAWGDAQLELTSLLCPTCGQHYDVMSAGRGLDTSGLHLEPFPLLVERGQAKIALPPLTTSFAPSTN